MLFAGHHPNRSTVLDSTLGVNLQDCCDSAGISGCSFVPGLLEPVYKTGPTDPGAVTAVVKAHLEGVIKDFGPVWMMA